MRVISQDGCLSLDFSRISVVREDCLIYTKYDFGIVSLGEYETEERAKEVFDLMHRNFWSENKIFNMPKA